MKVKYLFAYLLGALVLYMINWLIAQGINHNVLSDSADAMVSVSALAVSYTTYLIVALFMIPIFRIPRSVVVVAAILTEIYMFYQVMVV